MQQRVAQRLGLPMVASSDAHYVNREDAEAQDIIAFCRDNLAHFKCPRMVVFGPLPKTSTGKVQKFILRERAKNL